MLNVKNLGKVLVIGVALMLVGCTTKPSDVPDADITSDPDFTGSISILTKFGGEPDQQYFSDLAADYKELHPDVTFDLIQETDQSIKDKTKTLAASGSLPDIYFSWTGQWATNFVDGGLAADLTDVIAPGTEWGDTFGKAALKAFELDGGYYAVPLYNNAKFMGYNERAFEKAGVKVPTTFDDLLSVCGPLREAGYVPISFGNKDGWPALHYLQQLFAYNVPSDVLQRDFDPKTASWDDPGYVEALRQFKELVTQCTSSKNGSNGVLYTTAQEDLANERSAMYYQEILEFESSAGEGSRLKQGTFDFFQMPAPEGGNGNPNALEGAPEGYMINAKSPRASLALDFMKFATEKENAEALSAAPYGQPSTVIDAVTQENSGSSVYEGVQEINSAPQLFAWLDTATVPRVSDAWLSAGQALITGDATPEEALQNVQKANELVP
ncbi:extracellular solute-binding protein [Brevibacterium sp. K11IcPPYGO002]|uniref:ABC transporter substrate-binding protein n=1 Tax=Brevibacterium sp. K11IcPPYGO002 TaxID=3058837 RepID=UPI003D817BBB